MKRFLLLPLCFINFETSFSQWNSNPAVADTKVCTAPGFESDAISVSDGNNGIIVVFQSLSASLDSRNIYAQRINAEGILQWNTADNPKPVCVVSNYQTINDAISDNQGGVFVAWSDNRDANPGAIYVQHLNADGNPLWAVNGIKANNNPTYGSSYGRLCLDGVGGVLVSFTQYIGENNPQVFAQHLNSAGIAQWTSSGMQVITLAGQRFNGEIVSDDDGGAIVFFNDSRNSNFFPTYLLSTITWTYMLKELMVPATEFGQTMEL